MLDRQGCTLDTVPAAGQQVWLRDNANLSTGGTSRDVTDRVHPDVARLCLRVAALVGLDVAGIDLRLPDIARAAAADRRPGPDHRRRHRGQRRAGAAHAPGAGAGPRPRRG